MKNLNKNFKKILKRNYSTEKFGNSVYSSNLVFYVNGKKQIVHRDTIDPSSTLIDYLRRDLGLTGTKLTCGEGGCGACTVLQSSFDLNTKEVKNKSVNSCLVPLYQCHGSQITTTEGIGNTCLNKYDKHELHPIQEKMVEKFGSQCGFCTPGFVMTIYTTLLNNPKATYEELEKSLDGNLCRCTGYRPINEVLHLLSQGYVPPQLKESEKFSNDLKSESMLNIPIFAEKNGVKWFMPTTLEQLIELKEIFPNAKLVSGNTEIGIEQRFGRAEYHVLISPIKVKELNVFKSDANTLTVGASATLSDLYAHLKDLYKEEGKGKNVETPKQRGIRAINEQLQWFSGTSIRNTAGVGGNIVTASPISDLNPVWIASDSTFNLFSKKRGFRSVKAKDFFISYRKVAIEPDEVLVSVDYPFPKEFEYRESYKQSKRREDDIAIVTCSLSIEMEKKGSKKVKKASLAFGGVAPVPKKALKTEKFLETCGELDEKKFEEACKILSEELYVKEDAPGGKGHYRTTLALSFFYKFYLSALHQHGTPATNDVKIDSARVYKLAKREQSVSTQLSNFPKNDPISTNALHMSGKKQVSGAALYIDDIPEAKNELFGAMVTSTIPHGEILSIDTSEALKLEGVEGYFDINHVPGKNKIGDIIQDEDLFADKIVSRVGQLIGIIVANDPKVAKKAASLVKVEYKQLEDVLSIDQAMSKNSYFPLEHSIVKGNVEDVFNSNPKYVCEGEMRTGAQEHFYFEPHTQLVVPNEREITVYSSSQNLNKTQAFVAKVLGVPFHSVVAKAKRIGGGFGGKETDNIWMSCAAAVAVHHLQRPVRLLLERDEDMKYTGKRHPFYSKYKIAADENGKILGGKFMLRSNGGNWHDLSWPVMDRAIFHIDNSYFFPNMDVSGRVCKTNTVSNTAFRGFGGPQGMMSCETAIDHLSTVMGVRPEKVRQNNLYQTDEKTHYNQRVDVRLHELWSECEKSSNYVERLREIDEFNSQNKYRKRGIAIVPAKFGLSFTFLTLNQGHALIHLHTDGTLLITHGGVEMGQGLHTKVAQVASKILGIPLKDIHISETSTDKVANSSATAASMGSDIYGMAVMKACEELRERLEGYIQKFPQGTKMAEIANQAYLDRVSLTVNAFHKVPVEGYSFDTNSGTPFHYFTSGVACSEVEIDCLTGDHKIRRSDIVMDVGTSINPAIDIGQIEGAFIQGNGWLTTEELIWGDGKEFPWVKRGHILTAGPGNYKIPSSDDIPDQFNVTLLKDSDDPRLRSKAVFSSRGIGEPPLLLSGSVFFAIKDAIKNQRKEIGLKDHFYVDAPLTSEKIRMLCPDRFTSLVLSNSKSTTEIFADFKARSCY